MHNAEGSVVDGPYADHPSLSRRQSDCSLSSLSSDLGLLWVTMSYVGTRVGMVEVSMHDVEDFAVCYPYSGSS